MKAEEVLSVIGMKTNKKGKLKMAQPSKAPKKPMPKGGKKSNFGTKKGKPAC